MMIQFEAQQDPFLMENDTIAIRRVRTMEEVRSITEVIRRAWDLTDLENVATFEMKAVSDFGTVLMATSKEDPKTAIGFIYAFPMFPDKNYSHMMGIDPKWQGKNVGFELKMVHRNLAINHTNPKINEIVWTVDPLLPNNAWLNFGKLGVICDTYKINYYGMPEGVGIYGGVPTDRFLVKWQIRTEKVEKAIQNVRNGSYKNYPSYEELVDRYPTFNFVRNDKFMPNDTFEEDTEFLVEMPTNYQKIRETETKLAIDWRIRFREICIEYFQRGWVAYNYIRSLDQDKKWHNFYLFKKI